MTFCLKDKEEIKRRSERLKKLQNKPNLLDRFLIWLFNL